MEITNKSQRPSADKTRLQIIKAAKKLFLKNGFAGTSTNAIAKAANVNEALIFHHFKNKKNLWHEVKLCFIEKQDVLFQTQYDCAEEYFTDFINIKFKLYQHQPDLIRLIQWQLLTENQKALAGTTTTTLDQWLQPIRTLQEKGQIKKTISPNVILLYMIFNSYTPFMQNVITLTQGEIDEFKSLVINSCVEQFT